MKRAVKSHMKIAFFAIAFIFVSLACLLFGIAALLIWAPSVLVEIVGTVVIFACVIGGCILLIPVVSFAVASVTDKILSKRVKGKDI